MSTIPESVGRAYWQLGQTPPKPTRSGVSSNQLADLHKLIDQFVADLKQRLINPTTQPGQVRPVWDRVKNFWANLVHGREGQTNPYLWRNKLGDDLGMSLEDYRVLSGLSLQLEASLPAGAENLKISRLIDDWGRDFKQAVTNLLVPMVRPAPGAEPPMVRPAPGDTKTPDQPEGRKAYLDAYRTNAEKAVQSGMMTTFSNKDGTYDAKKIDAYRKIFDDMGYEMTDEKFDSHSGVTTWKVQKKAAPQATAQEDEFAAQKRQVRAAALRKKLDKIQKAVPPPEKFFIDMVNGLLAKGDDASLDKAEKYMSPTAVMDEPMPAKQWHELTPHEQEEWDAKGGGNARDISQKLRELGIRTLPWILRHDDPRLVPIYNTRGRELYRRLKDQGRIEDPKDPIKSPEDLALRVAAAKEAITRSKKVKNVEQEKADQIAKGFEALGSGIGDASNALNDKILGEKGYLSFTKPDAIKAFARLHPDWTQEVVGSETRFRPPAKEVPGEAPKAEPPVEPKPADAPPEVKPDAKPEQVTDEYKYSPGELIKQIKRMKAIIDDKDTSDYLAQMVKDGKLEKVAKKLKEIQERHEARNPQESAGAFNHWMPLAI